MFCVGGVKGRDTCVGDSGGPLTVQSESLKCLFYVVGVTSEGSSRCAKGKLAGCMNVQSYLDWIEETVWPIAA